MIPAKPRDCQGEGEIFDHATNSCKFCANSYICIPMKLLGQNTTSGIGCNEKEKSCVCTGKFKHSDPNNMRSRCKPVGTLDFRKQERTGNNGDSDLNLLSYTLWTLVIVGIVVGILFLARFKYKSFYK